MIAYHQYSMAEFVRKLHQQAEKLREEDRHQDALLLYDQVIDRYNNQQNYRGFVEAWMGKCLTYKHLYLLTHDPSYITLATDAAQKALAAAKKHALTELLPFCLFRFGEIAMLSGDYPLAIDFYTQTLASYSHDDAQRGDFQYHLGESQYRNGETMTGFNTIMQGIRMIEKHEKTTDSFFWHVWLSGGYLRLAELLWKDDPKQAHEYLAQAADIIEHDDRLVIRKRQLEELKDKIAKAKP